MNTKPRIYVDFNKLDRNQSAILTCIRTLDELDSQGIVLQEGLELRIYMPDDVDECGNLDSLEVDAVVHYSEQLGCWVAAYDCDQLKYRSGTNEVSEVDPVIREMMRGNGVRGKRGHCAKINTDRGEIRQTVK